MNLPLPPDVSLYQIALDASAPSQPFCVSRTTLKSLIGLLIDVLIENKIPALLWVKLPPTLGWQPGLKRYWQQAGVSQTIYLCNCFEEELVEFVDGVAQADQLKQESQIVPVQLMSGRQLDRDYFFVIRSQLFSALIVVDEPELSPGTALNPSQPRSAVVSFEPRVIQAVLEGIRKAIAHTNPLPKDLLEQWTSKVSSGSTLDENVLLTQLLLKQIQRTEKISYSSAQRPAQSNTDTSQRLRNDELLKRVTQELRTPLSNMKTALRLLDSPQLKPAQRQRYMQLLHTECDRQTSLLSGFLDLVQLEGDPQPTIMPSVQIADIVPGVVSTYQPIAQEKGIQLGYTIPSDLPPVSCLETWLRQILINLLHNSLKFTPTGGQVKVLATLQGEYVQLAFSDTGIGIADSEIPKIFDSFYRGRLSAGEETGAGLGLTIAQRLLLRCGGSISVTSKLGEGSNFKVLLPITSPN
jgi:two-component system, OmpR family, phosphate regulon sensor histidine kinase PhoR